MEKETKYLKYIDYLDYEEFIKIKMNEKFGKDMKVMAGRRTFGDGKAVIEFIAGLEDSNKVERITKGVATFEDYKCYIKFKNYHILHSKEWGQFICDTMLEKMQEGYETDFMVENYKQDYNFYWQQVRQQEVAKANENYNANKM